MGDDGWDWELEKNDHGFTIHRRPELSTPIGGIILRGWLVIDNDGALWFFPGEDNEPEKVNNEWTGFNPIMVNKEPEGMPGYLRDKPSSVVFKSI